MHPGLEQFAQQHVQGLAFLHEMQGPHDFGQARAFLVLLEAAAQGAALHQAHQVLVVLAVDRNAAEMPDARVLVGLFHGDVLGQGKDHGTRGHDLMHAFLIQGQHVADEIFLIGLDAPGLARKAGHGADVVLGNLRRAGGRRHQAGEQAREPEQRRKQLDGQGQGAGQGAGQGRGIGHAQGFGHDFAEGQDHDGEGQGKERHVLRAEDRQKSRARNGGTGGVGHGVQGQDGGNGLVHLSAHFIEQFAHGAAHAAQAFNGGPGHGVQGRLGERTGKRDQNGYADGQDKGEHDAESCGCGLTGGHGARRRTRWASPYLYG